MRKKIMPEKDKGNCKRAHFTEKWWIALGSIVAALALLGSITGWLLTSTSTSAGNNVRIQNLEQQHAAFNSRLDKIDSKLDSIVPTLARIEQEIADMKGHRIDPPDSGGSKDYSLRTPPKKSGVMAKH